MIRSRHFGPLALGFALLPSCGPTIFGLASGGGSGGGGSSGEPPLESQISSGPDPITRARDATFEFTANQPGASFECSLDGVGFIPVPNPYVITNLVDGNHLLRVRAVTMAGIVEDSPATYSWTVDTQAPVVGISFPPSRSLTNATSVQVRGSGSDATAIASIDVLGVSAVTDDAFERWSATIPVAQREQQLILDAFDAAGNRTFDPLAATIERVDRVLHRPVAVAVDSVEGQALCADTAESLTYVDLDTGDHVLVSGPTKGLGPPFGGIVSVKMDSKSGRAIVLDEAAGILSVNTVTGDRVEISGPTVGTGPLFECASGLFVDAERDRILVVDDQCLVSGGFLLEVDMLSGQRSVVLDVQDLGALVRMGQVVSWDEVRERAIIFVSEPDRLLFVNVADGSTSLVSGDGRGSGPGFDGWPLDVAIQPTMDRVLLSEPVWTGSEYDATRILAVDLATGDRTIVSDGSVGSGPMFEVPQQIALEESRSRLLVVDPVHSSGLFIVDLGSGNRQAFTVLGPGPLFAGVRGIAHDTEGRRVVVVDSSREALMAVDLQTSARSILSDRDTGFGPQLDNPSGVALDVDRDRAFVVDLREEALIAVDLTTGDRVVISGDGVGAGPSFSSPWDVTLSVETDEALIVDAGLEALLAVDLATGDRRVVSGSGTGAGPSLDWPLGITLEPGGTRALVVDKDLRSVVGIDRASGDRTIISDDEHGAGPTLLDPRSIACPADGSGAYVADVEGIVHVDLITGDRSVVSGAFDGKGIDLCRPIGLVPGQNEGTLFVVDSSVVALFLVDVDRGDRVVLSK